MATKVIPIGRVLFGNEHWRSYRAIDEVEVYCELLEDLQGKIDSLEIRGKDEEVTLINIQAVLSSYAFEIALKLGIPLIVNTSSGIMNTDSGHREHSPERSDGLASQFIPSESRFPLF